MVRSGFDIGEGFRDKDNAVRFGPDPGEAAIGPVAAAHVAVRRLAVGFPRVHFAKEEDFDWFVVLAEEVHLKRGIGPLPRNEPEPWPLGGAELFALNDFQIARLDEEVADLGIVGGVPVALTHAPEVILFDEVQFIGALFDGDAGDIVDGEIAQELQADGRVSGFPGSRLLFAQEQARAAKDEHEHEEDSELFAIHFAPVSLRL